MRSDAAWVTGHRAAAQSAPAYISLALGICALTVWALLQGWTFGVLLIGISALVVVLAAVIATAIAASRAANDPMTTASPPVIVALEAQTPEWEGLRFGVRRSRISPAAGGLAKVSDAVNVIYAQRNPSLSSIQILLPSVFIDPSNQA